MRCGPRRVTAILAGVVAGRGQFPLVVMAVVIAEWVQSSPGKPLRIRLGAVRDRRSLLVHDCGHGGAGLSLCWGPAVGVLQRFRSHVIARRWPAGCPGNRPGSDCVSLASSDLTA